MKSTLIVATLFTAALATSATPSFAAKNNGAFNQSAESNKVTASYCKIAKTMFQHDVKVLNDAPPGSKEQSDARIIANETLGNAWAAGCAWAQ